MNETFLYGKSGKLSGGACTELGHQPATMELDSPDRDEEEGGDFFVLLTFGDKLQNLALPAREIQNVLRASREWWERRDPNS